MRHLYHQLYLTIIASLLLVVLIGRPPVAARAERHARDPAHSRSPASWWRRELPPPSARRRQQQEAIDRLHDRLDIDLGLFDGGSPRWLAAAGDVPCPAGRAAQSAWLDLRPWRCRPGPCGCPDDRWIVAAAVAAAAPSGVPADHRFLGGIALAVALCAYPVVRRLTAPARTAASAASSQLGAGDLSARVEIEGNDEVARLAASFNRAAARIEELVEAAQAAARQHLARAAHAAVAHPPRHRIPARRAAAAPGEKPSFSATLPSSTA